eukprot:gnl/TRDRNA2_/TRDRNA2_177204_c2_seq12.p1 gnl/TRDRNA2_/TRDRNA2_177204_c2~~gnl/TRDRNA2_/TRDRNA2_177204_c2_seq12.p1  ORF type:complete len:146 (-),score=10.38 gnl/TRDRNA2_/TRDRNA2_177204_c2_seq12:214-651(-)
MLCPCCYRGVRDFLGTRRERNPGHLTHAKSQMCGLQLLDSGATARSTQATTPSTATAFASWKNAGTKIASPQLRMDLRHCSLIWRSLFLQRLLLEKRLFPAVHSTSDYTQSDLIFHSKDLEPCLSQTKEERVAISSQYFTHTHTH